MKKSLPGMHKTYVIIFTGLIFFFSAFIILSFFSHPAADDYILGYRIRDEGFWGFQQSIYLHWGGRFTSTFLGAVFAVNDFVFKHYYFHPIVLMLVSFAGIFFCFSSINKYFLKQYYTYLQTLIASAVYLVVLCCCYSEISTAFYWFSSAITYQAPIALFHAGMGSCITAAYLNSKKKYFYIVVTCLCIAAITGSNEMIAITLGIFLFLNAVVITRFFPTRIKLLSLYLSIFITGFIILTISPGTKERWTGVLHAGVLKSLLFSVLRVVYTLWHIFKEPVFWFGGVFIFLQANSISSRLQLTFPAFFNWLAARKRKMFVLAMVILVANYFPLMYVSNGSLPERATNSAVFFAILLLYSCFFLYGATTTQKLLFPRRFTYILAVGVSIAIVFNNVCFKLAQNIFAGYFYDKVLTSRENTLASAAKKGQNSVVLPDYDKALKKEVKLSFPQGSRRQVEALVYRKPEYIYVFDDLATEYSIDVLEKYYKVDSINVIRN